MEDISVIELDDVEILLSVSDIDVVVEVVVGIADELVLAEVDDVVGTSGLWALVDKVDVVLEDVVLEVVVSFGLAAATLIDVSGLAFCAELSFELVVPAV